MVYAKSCRMMYEFNSFAFSAAFVVIGYFFPIFIQCCVRVLKIVSVSDASDWLQKYTNKIELMNA